MESKKYSAANQAKLKRVAIAMQMLLDDLLTSGFHGTGRLELTISNGTIQTICRTTERVDKES